MLVKNVVQMSTPKEFDRKICKRISQRRHVTRVYCKKDVIDDFNDKRNKNVNDTMDTLKKNVIQDLEYIETFEKRKLMRINGLLNDIKKHSEKDISYIKDLYDLLQPSTTTEKKVNTEGSDVDENDLYFESSDEI